ncbi:uncharacterized protein LOC131670000 [Phymastichus coffea]|uniref:uncharacterized protein LOC131670000 n=1 Tax=Phymastichus coffea TaxID=108790 RepID=UPI00273C2CBC|nr:uncharacterized protein LOC131670000 [Phymastichus coffea]
MKFFISCSLIVLLCFVFSFTEAASKQRDKRSISTDQCPQNLTLEECKNWVEEKSKTMNWCHRYYLSGLSIEWQRCGRAFCGENTRLVDEDLSRPYPDCCERCEIIDPSKPAKWSATGK